nr:NAD(+) synthase [uncultured Flavonifractor sp.]
MRNYQHEFDARVDFIRSLLTKSGAAGIVYGNSGGKDSALVGILCKAACKNTLGIIMPCGSKRNYGQDLEDGLTVARQYQIETRTLDLTPLKNVAVQQLTVVTKLTPSGLTNLAPRLRMAALYAVAASENRLVAGTGNRSEAYVGYFTKWGDGAHDFNPISDLTVTEIYEFLRWLNAPPCVIEKKPSAGLFDGQTDEQELGITYRDLDAYLSGEAISNTAKQKIRQMHEKSEHKHKGIIVYEKSLDISRIDNLKGENIQWI